MFDRSGKAVRAVKLIGCYPTVVGEIAYDSTAAGNVVTLNVTLAYQWWTAEGAYTGEVVP